MTALTAPGTAASPRRGSRFVGAITGAATSVVSAALTPHKASLRRLTEMPLSVIGTGGIDFAAFHVNHGVGWLVLGVSLWVVEHLIADVEDSEMR